MFFSWELSRRTVARTGARQRRRAQRRSSIAVEHLEPRTLLSANVIVVVPGPGTPIQDAIDSAQSGATILLSKGVYQEQITIDKDLTLAGKTWDSKGVEIRPPAEDTDSADSLAVAGTTVTAGAERVVLKNFRVTGWSGDGINVQEDPSEALGVENVTLSNVSVDHNQGDGIQLNEVGSVRMTKVQAGNNGDDGFEVAAATGDIDIARSQFDSNGTGVENHGLEIKEVAGSVTLHNVQANSNGDDGLRISGAQDASTVSSKSSENAGNSDDGAGSHRGRDFWTHWGPGCGHEEDGSDAGNVTIKNSRFCNNQGCGVTIKQASAVDIFFSKLNENGAHGVQLDSANAVRIQNSKACSNGLYGLSAATCSPVTVKHSAFTANTGGSISLNEVDEYSSHHVTADRPVERTPAVDSTNAPSSNRPTKSGDAWSRQERNSRNSPSHWPAHHIDY